MRHERTYDSHRRVGAEIDKYIEEFSNGGTWSASTVLDVRGDFNQFLAILGDVPVALLGHDDLNRLKDVLLALPAGMNKSPQTKGKTVEEVLALGLPPQSANTVKKKWTRLTSFFDWLVGKGLIDRNYAKGKKPKAKAHSYEKFSREDLSGHRFTLRFKPEPACALLLGTDPVVSDKSRIRHRSTLPDYMTKRTFNLYPGYPSWPLAQGGKRNIVVRR